MSCLPNGQIWEKLCQWKRTWGPFYNHGLTLIPAWISNHMSRKVWDEITYPFPNLKYHCWREEMDRKFHPKLYNVCNYLSMLISKLMHVSKKALWWRHNGHNSISNHQPHDCLLYRLFRHRSKKTSKLHVTGLCAGSPRWIPHTNGQ